MPSVGLFHVAPLIEQGNLCRHQERRRVRVPTIGLVAAVSAACAVAGCALVVPTRNAAPFAVLKLAKETTEPGKGQFCVSFDGSLSHDMSSEEDTSGKVAAFIWDFGDGSPVATLSAGQTSSPPPESCFVPGCTGTCPDAPQHIYTMPPGSVVLSKLQVRDNDGAISEPATLRVSLRTNLPPVARFLAVPGAATLTAALDASASSDPDPEDVDRLHFFWNFDDGQCDPPNTGCAVSSNSSLCRTDKNDDRHRTLEHRYASSGVYRPSLFVSDGQLCSGPAYQDVTIPK